MKAVYVEITSTQGSVPRDAGTVMQVTADQVLGTIGGGALEYQAIETAREMLSRKTCAQTRRVPLGPGLGQCCGGAVTLRFSDEAKPVDSPLSTLPLVAPKGLPAIPLWVWGAGHVGRAVVRHALTCRAFDVTWVDDRNDRFPDPLPGGLAHLVAADMPRLAAHAPKDAQHLILTYSHDIDLALCAALIRRGFRFCGLIGSQTKWSRFRRRLTGMGLDPSGIACPIGDKSRGKHPDAIAHGTLAGILNTASTKELQ